MDRATARKSLEERIDADRDRLIETLRDFVRINTENPPGDTRDGATFIEKLLAADDLAYDVYAADADKPNIVADLEGSGPGKHLILNGHIDVFPTGDLAEWERDPFSAEILGGTHVHGRGSVDMKCGTTASVMAFKYLSHVRAAFPGKVTLTVVSDEETGGKLGTGYLLETMPERITGDCVLNGEPSSLHTVRYGEKAINGLVFTVRTPGAHGAYTHLSKSATKIAARLICDLDRLEALEPEVPANLHAIMNRPDVRSAVDAGLGAGAADTVQRLTLNIGKINGGVKVNMLPGTCRFEADLRLPPGITRERVMAEIETILKDYPEATVEAGENTLDRCYWSDPEGAMLGMIQDNAEKASGIRPAPVLTLGATDCRFWRRLGVDAYVYGCSPAGMGMPDEAVSIAEFLAVVKVHTLSAFDYLTA